MKSITKLLTEVRRSTRNSDTTSIVDNEFIEAFNDAQDMGQSIIASVFPDLFVSQEIINTVANQEAYSITERVFLTTRIKTMEYSQTGQITDYYEIPPRSYKERSTVPGYPSFYIRRENGFYLNPIPNASSQKIRVTYERELDEVDIRRAKVTSTTGTPITAITLNNASFPTNADILTLEVGDYICVSDPYGVVKAYNIPVTSATATSITVPSHTLGSGETISAGDYITIGQYTTTHSKLPQTCERFLKTYVEWKVFNRDSSDQATAKLAELNSIREDMLASFANPSRDVHYVAIIDEDIL